MKEERIRFTCPRRIALVGISPFPKDDYIMELSEACEGWLVSFNPVESAGKKIIENIIGLLGEKGEGECTPFAIKLDVEGCEAELRVYQKQDIEEKIIAEVKTNYPEREYYLAVKPWWPNLFTQRTNKWIHIDRHLAEALGMEYGQTWEISSGSLVLKIA